MQVVHARSCGLDVHKKSVVACVLVTEPAGMVRRQVRTFAPMTADLLALDDWLTTRAITQIARESTGGYWRPVCNLLEADERPITLVNAQHLKAVPGRKPTSRTASGSLIFSATGWCRRVSSRPPRSAPCAS